MIGLLSDFGILDMVRHDVKHTSYFETDEILGLPAHMKPFFDRSKPKEISADKSDTDEPVRRTWQAQRQWLPEH